jgi:hypothetical protein
VLLILPILTPHLENYCCGNGILGIGSGLRGFGVDTYNDNVSCMDQVPLGRVWLVQHSYRKK